MAVGSHQIAYYDLAGNFQEVRSAVAQDLARAAILEEHGHIIDILNSMSKEERLDIEPDVDELIYKSAQAY